MLQGCFLHAVSANATPIPSGNAAVRIGAIT
jgi:hypothetical protein